MPFLNRYSKLEQVPDESSIFKNEAGFWFFDENGSDCLGPFPDLVECKSVALIYGQYLIDGSMPPMDILKRIVNGKLIWLSGSEFEGSEVRDE
jgi:hypothetical protein